MLDLAVVIVTWNSANIIAAALQSLLDDLDGSGLRGTVWVVDCASSDATAALIRARFPQVRLIACQENVGFSRANNIALRAMGFDGRRDAPPLPQAVYLLNPDTVTHSGATRTLYDALFAETEVGVVGARLTFGDGSFQHSAFMFPDLGQIWAEFFPLPGRFAEGRFNGRYARSQYEQGAPFAVDFTLGATMMLKRAVLLETGLFDEQFFLYCEEVDWAWRIRAAGWEIHCVPQAHVTHLGGQSTGQVAPESLLRLWQSRLLLYQKHYPRWKEWLARRLLIWGMRRRLAALDGAGGRLGAAFQEVIEMAGS